MEISEIKVEFMKPVLLKAGIPVAITLASFVLAKIVKRKSLFSKASSEEEVRAETKACDLYTGEESSYKLLLDSLIVKESIEFQELRSKMEKLEKHFFSYQEMKDREVEIVEIQNKLFLEINRAELWGREILMIEEENMRFENLILEYLKILGMLQFSRLKNQKLNKKVMKLMKNSKEQSRILRKNNLTIKYKEAEILKNQEVMEVKIESIKKMETEIEELKLIVEQMQQEKLELANKLRLLEKKSDASKEVEEEKVTKENYNSLASALEQLQQEEAAEVKELVYLKWCNACLRHELMRRNQEQEEHLEIENNKPIMELMNSGGTGAEINEEYLGGSDNECSLGQLGHHSCLGTPSSSGGHSQAHSKRRKLIAKFKRWVEGIEKNRSLDEKLEKHGKNCFPRHSPISLGKEALYLPARKSCSSA